MAGECIYIPGSSRLYTTCLLQQLPCSKLEQKEVHTLREEQERCQQASWPYSQLTLDCMGIILIFSPKTQVPLPKLSNHLGRNSEELELQVYVATRSRWTWRRVLGGATAAAGVMQLRRYSNKQAGNAAAAAAAAITASSFVQLLYIFPQIPICLFSEQNTAAAAAGSRA